MESKSLYNSPPPAHLSTPPTHTPDPEMVALSKPHVQMPGPEMVSNHNPVPEMVSNHTPVPEMLNLSPSNAPIPVMVSRHTPIPAMTAGQNPLPEMGMKPVREPPVEGPLDLSTRPRIPDGSYDGPLDLTIGKPKQSESQNLQSCKSITPKSVDDTPDDDVIVVGVQRGRSRIPQLSSGPGIPQLQRRHDLPLGRLDSRHSINRHDINDPRHLASRNPNKATTMYSMCKKDAYTGGVAYTPFDLGTGLTRLKQMLMMAKDPQQVKQLAHSFQKMALSALLRSRLHQQQQLKASIADRANTPQKFQTPSSSSRGSSPATSARGTPPSSIIGTPLIKMTPPSSAIGTPPGKMTPPSSSIGTPPAQLIPVSLTSDTTSIQNSPVTIGTSAATPPVTVITPSDSSSNIPVGSPPLTMGSVANYKANLLYTEDSTQQTFVTSQQSLPGTPTNRGMANSPAVSTTTSNSPATTNAKGRSSSPAGNFESEYMKYVRSKRFMSGGSTCDTTTERQQQQQGDTATPVQPPQQLQINKTQSAKSSDHLNRKLAKASFADYQYIIAEINKVTKSALQMADTMYRKKHGLPAGNSKITPPPAHSKINVNRVDPKKPHLNMLMKGQSHLMLQRAEGQSHLMRGIRSGIPQIQLQNQPQRSIVSPIKPEELPGFQAGKKSIDLPPLQPIYTLNGGKGPLPQRVKTWTPPVGLPSTNPIITSQDDGNKRINESNTHSQVVSYDHNSPEPLRVPKYSSGNDTQEMLSAYGGQEESVSESQPLALDHQSSDSSNGYQEIIQQKQQDDGHISTEPKVIEIAPESSGTGSQVIPKSDGGAVAYQSNRCLSGGTVSTPTVIAGRMPTDLLSQGRLQVPSFTCMSPNGSTVVKPVTSTFIGWNVSGYKRIPVANVNPIKVKDGSYQGQQFLDGGHNGGQPTDQSMMGHLARQPESETNEQLRSQSTSAAETFGEPKPPSGRQNQSALDYRAMYNDRYINSNKMENQTGSHYRPPCILNMGSSSQSIAPNSSNIRPSTHHIQNKSGNTEVASFLNNDIPIIQGHFRPPGIMATPTTYKAQKKIKDDKPIKKRKKKAVKPEDESIQETGQKDKIHKTKSGKVAKVKTSKSVESKTAAIKAILRDGMATVPANITDGSTEDTAVVKTGKKKNKDKGKGVKFHSSDDEVGEDVDKVQANLEDSTNGDNDGPDESRYLSSQKVPAAKGRKPGRKKRKKKGEGHLEENTKVKYKKSSVKAELIEQEDNVTTQNQKQLLVNKPKIKGKKRGRKSKENRLVRYCVTGLYSYNKNAKYEEELRREEERKFLLRARREARRSTTTSQEDGGENEASKDGTDMFNDGVTVTNEHVDKNAAGLIESTVDVSPVSPVTLPNRLALKRKRVGVTKGTKMVKKRRKPISVHVVGDPLPGKSVSGDVHQIGEMGGVNEEQMVDSGCLQSESLRSNVDGRKLKKRRRRRWYKKRKQQPLQYIQLSNEFCMGEVDETHFNEGVYEPPLDLAVAQGHDLDFDLQVSHVDPALLAELKGIVVCRETGETKLHRLTRMGHEDLAVRCIEAGLFDVNGRDHAGYTALHESCVTGRLRVAKTLLVNGANVDAAALDGTRPLHDAVDHHRLELVRLLLSCGADPRTSTYSGKTPMKIARMPDMQELLSGHLQDINGTKSGDLEKHWQFTMKSEQKHYDLLGFDVFGDVPKDVDSEEEEMNFEFWDSSPLQCYYICLDAETGPRNYYLLNDIAQIKNMPPGDFKLLNFDMTYKLLTKQEAMDICEVYYPNGKASLDVIYKENKEMEYVESCGLLLSMLDIEMTTITGSDVAQYKPSDDISFTETPIERMSSEDGSHVITTDSTDTTEVTVVPIKSCSRKLRFSKDNALKEEANETNVGNLNNHNKTVVCTASSNHNNRNLSCSSIDEPLPVLEKVGNDAEMEDIKTTTKEDNSEKQKNNDDMPCLTLCV